MDSYLELIFTNGWVDLIVELVCRDECIDLTVLLVCGACLFGACPSGGKPLRAEALGRALSTER